MIDNNLPYIKWKNLFVIPTFHSRIEFSKVVQKAFFMVYPDLIAVELPNNVKKEVIEGIDRLPFLSLIAYADSLTPDKVNFIPVDPTDSIIHAIKIGLQQNVPIEFVDLSVKNYQPETFQLPDDYCLTHLDIGMFYHQISRFFEATIYEEKDRLRSQVNFQELFTAKDQLDISFTNVEKDLLREMYMASYLLKLMPVYHRILFVVGMAHWESIKYYLEHSSLLKNVDIDLQPHKFLKVYNVKGNDAQYFFRELPYHAYKWVLFNKQFFEQLLEQIQTPEELESHIEKFDKNAHIKEIYLSAKDLYEEEFKESINLQQLKNLFQYTRNLSITENRLTPDLFHLLVSSKNLVDDDYAWKVLKEAIKYPYDDKSEEYETITLSMKGAFDPNGRYIKLKRHHPYYYKEHETIPLDKRPEEQYPGEWKEKWNEQKDWTVSYPPEDILEENYFAYLRHKTLKNLKERRIQIEEFKSSIKDGIAIKETVRNWGITNKIYVKNEQQIQGKIDTLLVIFDEDTKKPEQYPYKLTWWAEHDKESNLAFYSTRPGDYLIGPGISHVEIGGLLSIFPPIYIEDVFKSYMDSNYKDAHSKAERLLKAGILYSREKYIVYIAKHPPRKYFYTLAGVKHRQIIFIPLDTYPKESLKTIKHLHILAGRDKRSIAHHYIFLNK
ncbi:MAG: putative TraB determinant protein [Promethearchaeota archaeon]|nr:MAG: putative TraB determinant protein [Candidatus Lokiarchaeota archaeon]